MKKVMLLIGLGLGLVAGCGVKTVPLTTETETNHLRDSLSSKETKHSTFDSLTEKVNEKILPGATVGIILTKKQWDSLTLALGTLPKQQKIVVQDPKLKAQLILYRDSLNNFHLVCSALDQRYFEREVYHRTIAETYEKQLTQLKEENTLLRKEIVVLKESKWRKFWNNVGNFFRNGFTWLIIAVIVGGIIWIGLKKLRLR